MSDVGSNSLLTAFVELRAKASSNFESEARGQLLPGLGRIATDAAALIADKKLFDIGKEGLDRLGDVQKTLAQTDVVLRSTGGAAGVSAAGVEELAASLSKMSGVDHEAIQGAENLILQMGGIKNAAGAGKDIFDRTTRAALDLSVAMGTDVSSAASTLSLALEDPSAALTRLRRAHIVLSEEQKQTITNFAEVGDVASAQGVILDQVEKQVGGSAKAYGETLPGELAKAKTAMTDAKAALTAGLAPALEAGAGIVTGLAEKFSGLPGPVREGAGAIALVGTGLLSLLGPAADAARLITTVRAAHAAAATAAVVQAGAETELAVAEDAVATNSAATVAGLYATATASGTATVASGGLVATLGKAGIGLAVAAGVAALYEYGQSLNKTTLSTEELTNATKLSAPQLAAFIAELTRDSVGPFSGMLDDTIAKLAAMGPAGVGALTQVRDQLKASGQDTSKYDAAIAGAAQSQANLNDATAAGNAALGDITASADDATKAMLALQQAAAAASASVGSVQSAAATGLLSSGDAIAAAESRVADARDKERVAGERLNGGVQREQEALAAAVEAASARIVSAEQSVIDARQAVADAEEKLAHAGEHEALAVNDAQDAIDAAQRKLNASTPEERGPAQHALDDAKQKLVDAKEALDRAKPDAQRALDAAVRGVNDALRSEADAHRSLADAQQAQREGSHLAEQAQRDYDTAVRSVNDAVLAQAQAVANQKQLQEELASGIKTGPVEALGLLKDAYKAAAAELDPNSPDTARLLYLLASLSGASVEVTFGAPGGGDTPGRVSRRAAGGPVKAGEVFMGAEQGTEMLLLNHGPGLYRSPGDGVVKTAGETAGMLGGHTHHHYQVIVQPVASDTLESAVRRELGRMESLRVLQSAGG